MGNGDPLIGSAQGYNLEEGTLYFAVLLDFHRRSIEADSSIFEKQGIESKNDSEFFLFEKTNSSYSNFMVSSYLYELYFDDV